MKTKEFPILLRSLTMNNEELLPALQKSQKHLIIVEGKKDKAALEKLGFPLILVLNEDGKSLYEKIEEIELLAGKRKVCILTDFDKKGKQLYLLVKRELGLRGVGLDNTLRSILLRYHVSHIEGLARFLEHQQKPGYAGRRGAR